MQIELKPPFTRAQVRAIRASAKALARQVAAGGYGAHTGASVIRVTRPAAMRVFEREVAAMLRATTREGCFRLACLSAVDGVAWSGGKDDRPECRVWIALGLDVDGRIATVWDFAKAEDDVRKERRAMMQALKPRLELHQGYSGLVPPAALEAAETLGAA